MDDLSDLVGEDVLLPDTEFSPYVEGQQIEGRILKVLKPTKRYPAGRLELSLLVDGRRQTFLWDQSLFKRAWVVPHASNTTTTPRRKAGPTPLKTPTRRNSTVTLTPLAGSEDLPTPTLRGGSTPLSASGLRSAPHSLATTPAAGTSRSAKNTPAKAPTPSTPAKTTAASLPPSVHPPISKLQTITNVVILVLVALPAIYVAHHLRNNCSDADKKLDLSGTVSEFQADWRAALQRVSQPTWWCSLGYHNPITAANVIFFLNVDVLFWVLGLIQGSTWLIDPYWTIIPPMIGWFYKTHPASNADPTRSAVSLSLLLVWSLRLTHSYFRREGYQLGAREDWRFTDMSAKIGRNWWWVSFFAAYVSQHLMLVGITLPLAAVHRSTDPWNIIDTVSTILAVAGLLLAFISDNQLRAFMLANEKRVANGQKPILILDTGLFRYSRHPNYLGEQMWWWGLGGFAVSVGSPWMLIGAAFNSLSLVFVTIMVEARMMRRPERQALFKQYQATTSVWFPWFKLKSRAAQKQD